jgi:hypothetical protein
LLPHWAATTLGIDRISESIGNTDFSALEFRMSRAKSKVSGYPDLNFDPLTWPQGPIRRGFGFYDRGITPIPGSGTEVIYTFNDSNLPVGVRRLTAPGVNGNTVLLALHPYFVERPAFRSLVRAVLTDFGEVMIP